VGPEPKLLDDLGRGRPRPVYLLHGEEAYLVGRALEILRARLLGEGGAGTWRTLWAAADGDLAAALDDLQSPPLFGGPQVLVVRNVEALDDAVEARVLALLPLLGSGGTLVLVARDANKVRRLAAACAKTGAVYAFPLLPERDVRAAQPWVDRLARERGHQIAPAAAQELVERSGTSLGVLAGELDKLALHAGDGHRIEVTHVRAVVPATRTHEVQELTMRLAAGDARGASGTLRRLLAEGEPPVRLLAFLAANLRGTLHVAELREQGLGTDEIARRLGMPAWLVGKRQHRGRARDLVQALLVLRRLDLELKSPAPPEAAFEAALLEIAAVSSRS
jgi:DNA polymerase-3 subunit delta